MKIIYLGFEKSQRSVTCDFLRYINILTYLVTCSAYDAAYCYIRHTKRVVFVSVTYPDAVWMTDSRGCKKPCTTWAPFPLAGIATFVVGKVPARSTIHTHKCSVHGLPVDAGEYDTIRYDTVD